MKWQRTFPGKAVCHIGPLWPKSSDPSIIHRKQPLFGLCLSRMFTLGDQSALLALTCEMAPLRVCAGSIVWCMGNVDQIASVVGFASLTPQAVDSIELLAAPECLWSTLRWSRSVDWDPRVSSSRSWTSGSLDATEAERSRKEPTNKTWSCYNRLNCLLQLQWKMQ